MFDRYRQNCKYPHSNAYRGVFHLVYCLTTTKDPSRCPHIMGDFTPRYIVDGYRWKTKWYHINKTEPEVLMPQKIKLLLPGARIIMMFRNPTDRLYSSYRYFDFKNVKDRQNKSLQDFDMRAQSQVKNWQMCLSNVDNPRLCMYGYERLRTKWRRQPKFWEYSSYDQVRYGLYHMYVREWLQVFPRHQMLFMKYEDYVQDPVGVISRDVLPFLGAEAFSKESLDVLRGYERTGVRFNESPPSDLPSQMQNNTRALLAEFYRPHNQQLVELLQDSRFLWQ